MFIYLKSIHEYKEPLKQIFVPQHRYRIGNKKLGDECTCVADARKKCGRNLY